MSTLTSVGITCEAVKKNLVHNLYLEVAEAKLVHSRQILRWTGTAERIIVKNILHDSFPLESRNVCAEAKVSIDRVQVNVC